MFKAVLYGYFILYTSSNIGICTRKNTTNTLWRARGYDITCLQAEHIHLGACKDTRTQHVMKYQKTKTKNMTQIYPMTEKEACRNECYNYSLTCLPVTGPFLCSFPWFSIQGSRWGRGADSTEQRPSPNTAAPQGSGNMGTAQRTHAGRPNGRLHGHR